MDPGGGYDPVLPLESGGDTSYPGLVCHDGQGKSSIYLAKLRLPLD